MRDKVDKAKASRLINAGGVVLITAAYEDKSTITPCAWHMPVSKNPPLVAVALAKKHFSSELIKKSKEFVINVPDSSLLESIIFCGSVSGRSVNKFEKTPLSAQKTEVLIYAPVITECIADIECKLYESQQSGDHYLFIGQIVMAQARTSFFVNSVWDTNKAKLVFHLGGKSFMQSDQCQEFDK